MQITRKSIAGVMTQRLLKREKQVRRERSKRQAGVTDYRLFSGWCRQLAEPFAGHQDQVFFPGPFGFAGCRTSKFEHSLLKVNKRKRSMMLDRKVFVRHGNEDPFRYPAKLVNEEGLIDCASDMMARIVE